MAATTGRRLAVPQTVVEPRHLRYDAPAPGHAVRLHHEHDGPARHSENPSLSVRPDGPVVVARLARPAADQRRRRARLRLLRSGHGLFRRRPQPDDADVALRGDGAHGGPRPGHRPPVAQAGQELSRPAVGGARRLYAGPAADPAAPPVPRGDARPRSRAGGPDAPLAGRSRPAPAHLHLARLFAGGADPAAAHSHDGLGRRPGLRRVGPRRSPRRPLSRHPGRDLRRRSS